MEAYQTLTLRDVYVETLRNGSEWRLDLRIYCETADVALPYAGSWIIRLMDASGVLVYETQTDTIISGDQQRQATVSFHLKIASKQVRSEND